MVACINEGYIDWGVRRGLGHARNVGGEHRHHHRDSILQQRIPIGAKNPNRGMR